MLFSESMTSYSILYKKFLLSDWINSFAHAQNGCLQSESGFLSSVEGRGLDVEGRGFKVEGRGFEVEGSESQVEGQGLKWRVDDRKVGVELRSY